VTIYKQEFVVSIEEIETAITELAPSKLFALSSWFEKYQATVWDQQIEKDLEAGHLDDFLAEVDAEYDAGISHPL
jgi:hypothetical protein